MNNGVESKIDEMKEDINAEIMNVKDLIDTKIVEMNKTVDSRIVEMKEGINTKLIGIKEGINECHAEPSPCNSNTNCVDLPTGYVCCPEGHIGENCDIVINCLSNPCMHGDCSYDQTHDYKCICAQEWSGTNCDLCAQGWYGPNCDVCAQGWSGNNCDIC